MPSSEDGLPCNRDAHEDLLRKLRKLLPPEAVLTDKEDLRPFECDGLSVYRCLPLVVVLPETIAQVQAIMRLCHALQVPVVARGKAPVCPAGLCLCPMACC